MALQSQGLGGRVVGMLYGSRVKLSLATPHHVKQMAVQWDLAIHQNDANTHIATATALPRQREK